VWDLASSDGWQRIVWHPKQIIYRPEPLLPVELRLSGQFWDPEGLSDRDEYILVDQVDCALPHVLLSISQIRFLEIGLAAWLDHRAPIDTVLSPNEYQALSFRLEPRDQLISSVDKPICAVAYIAARVRCEWLLPVDPSCITAFHEAIQRWRKSLKSEGDQDANKAR
jgi:hypothetical protein